jgi:hypothetical protein
MAAKEMFALLVVASIMVNVWAQNNTFPHSYPNKPTGDFDPTWQNCEQLFLAFACLSRLHPSIP